MKHTYITTQTLLACLTRKAVVKKDIHAELQETIAERRRIMQRLESIAQRARVIDLYLETTKAA